MLGIPSKSGSTWDCPLEQPAIQDFRAWKVAMKLLIGERNLLKNSAGRSLAKPHQEWKWFHAGHDDTIFCKDNDHYISYTRGRSSTCTNQIFFHSVPQSQPIGLHRLHRRHYLTQHYYSCL